MTRWAIICTCTHLDSQHAERGPCSAQDSYGQPCECPELEPSQYHNDVNVQDAPDGHHWGPQLGGHRTPEGVGESKSPG